MDASERKRLLGIAANLYKTNLTQFNDFYVTLPNPDLILRKLGANPVIYKELLTDPHVFSCVQSRISGVSSMLWKLNYNQFTIENSQEYIAFMDAIFEKLNIDTLIKQMMDAVLYGYSVFEIIWKIDNGKIIPTKIIQRPNEYFQFNQAGQCLWIKNTTDPIPVKEDKFLVVQHDPTPDNPYGLAILSLCYWSVFFKKQTIKLWSKATDKNSDNFIYIHVNETANQAETDALVNYTLDQYYNKNIAVAVGPDTQINTLNNISANPELFTSFINFHNNEISKAVLSQTGTTENTSNVGSYAMSKTHFAIREDVIQSDCKMIMPMFDRLIYYITLYNFPEELSRRPYFELYAPYKIDNDLIERDLKLYQLGIRFDKKYIASTYNISETVFEIQDNSSYGMFNKNENNNDVVELKEEEENKELKIKDDNGNDITEQVKELETYVNNGAYKTIKEVIDNYEGSDYDELQDLLIQSFPNMPTENLTKFMEKVIIYQQLIGEAGL